MRLRFIYVGLRVGMDKLPMVQACSLNRDVCNLQRFEYEKHKSKRLEPQISQITQILDC